MDKKKLSRLKTPPVTGLEMFDIHKPSVPLPKPDGEPYDVRKLRREVKDKQSQTYQKRREGK